MTRFEPIQTFVSDWSYLFTRSNDGRRGPFDLLIGGTPVVKNGSGVGGIYYARVLPKLTAGISSKQIGKSGKFKLSATVTDAGDAVSGAKVSTKGNSAATSSKGQANVSVSGSPGDHLTVKITAPGYRTLTERVKL